jgi:cation diffusion facilitator family transporter
MHEGHLEELRCPRDAWNETKGREAGARWVVVLTAGMMVTELVVGYATRSLALTADGWHMATHAGALGLTAGAYWFARTRAHDERFAFGTGKVHALAGYTSAIVLALIALSMIAQSMVRFFRPEVVHFREALPVAVLGLAVNLASIKLLGGHGHDHSHGREGHEAHEHEHHHEHDHNHRAAYMHVLADAFTSVLAIVAIVAGRWFGWTFLDAVMGIVGGAVVLKWGLDLCRTAGSQLLDATRVLPLEAKLRSALEAVDDVRVADLHLWETGPGRRSCVLSLVTSSPRDARFYRERILEIADLAHLTVEVHVCREGHEPRAA